MYDAQIIPAWMYEHCYPKRYVGDVNHSEIEKTHRSQ